MIIASNTTTPRSQSTLTMGVSQTMLMKAPRFFGSPKSILTELFQNAFRAGAKNVTVTWNPKTRILKFEDDGCGCQPEDLIVVGESGWDGNSPAIDPAGIGVFSILRPEYCEQVTYRSANWAMTLSPENLETAQVDVHYFDERVVGMTVEIVLTPKADFANEYFVRQARGRYPMNVFWNELPKEPIPIFPETILDSVHWVNLDIDGVGTVELGKRYRTASISQFAIWQHAVMDSTALREAMNKAAQLHSNLARGIFQYINYVLVIDPVSAIRPKLPDRDDLIGDIHLDAACKKIVAVVMEHILKPLQPDLWPDRVRHNHSFEGQMREVSEIKPIAEVIFKDVPQDALIRKLVQIGWGLPALIMEHFGYKSVRWDDLTNYSKSTIQDDGWSLEVEWEGKQHYVRNTLVLDVESECLAQSICSQGVYAEVKHDCKTEVRYTDFVYKPGHLVAFAREIIVNGFSVQWLLYDNASRNIAGREDDRLVFVTTLSPLEFYKSIRVNDPDSDLYVSLVVWILYTQGDIYEYSELEDTEYEIKTAEIADDLRQDALRVAAPKLVKNAQVKTACGEVSKILRDVLYRLNNAQNIFERIGQTDETFPLVEEIADAVEKFNQILREKSDEIKDLSQEIGKTIEMLGEEIDSKFMGSAIQ